MLKVALWCEAGYLSVVKSFVEKLYNKYVTSFGGGELLITAVICDEKSVYADQSENYYISTEDYVAMYRAGAIGPLLIPADNYNSNHYTVLTDILKEGLSLDDVYLIKRIANHDFSGPEDVVNHIEPYLSAGYIPYLEYHVADKCNLNCIACEHYSGLVKEECFPDFDKFSKEFARMKELIDDIGMLRILGGEPLLNPELSKFVRLSREYYPNTEIFIVTNGLLVLQMSRELIDSILENNIIVFVSYYPPMIDKMGEIRQFFIDNGIKFEISPVNTCFTKKQTLKPADNTDMYYRCFQAHCNNLYQGKMATCFLPFTTKFFNEQYNTDLPTDEATDIMNPDLTTEKLLMNLLSPIERCKYCTNPVDIQWDYIRDKEDLSNWLVEVPKKKEKTEPLITIYTQCYNGEKYIEKCILSVINQSYTNFEYYVCNHGSTDNTQAIIDKYADLDSRIIPLYYTNDKRGFYPDFMKENAKGKYFAMLDSDDWWEPGHLEKMVDFSESYKLDMGVCGIRAFDEDKGNYNTLRKYPGVLIFSMKEISRYWNAIYTYLRTTWGKLIRMEALRAADFSTYYKNAQTFISDDTAFSLACFAKCGRVGILPEELLNYRINSGSVTARYKESQVENNYNIYLQFTSLLEELGDETASSKEFAINVFYDAINVAVDLLLKSDMGNEGKLREIDRILKIPCVADFINRFSNMNILFIAMIDEWMRENNL